MTINGQTIPGNPAYRWRPPEILDYNGKGEPIRADGSSLELVYDIMTPTDWDFYVTTLLSGSPSAEFTSASLYDNNGDSTSFTHCIVYAPVRDKWNNGRHENTTVTITDIY